MRKPKRIRLAGVLGNPIAHSLSPNLHGFWIKRYAIDGYYIPMLVNKNEVGKSIESLKTLGFSGANVTIPFKEEVIKYVDNVSEIGANIGAVNTISINTEGEVSAENTDVYGFVKNLDSAVPEWENDVNNVVILGGGGASRAVVAALKNKNIKTKRIINRSIEKPYLIKEEIDKGIEIVNWNNLADIVEDCDMLINSTSLGMKGQPSLEIDTSIMKKKAIVYDLVYTPLETELIKSAKKNQIRFIGGLGMLMFQALKGFEIWFGKQPEADEETMLFLKDLLNEKK